MDIDLGMHDVQALSSGDAIVGIFARFGYNTDARILQTPANLGITAEGTSRPIKKIELIADQEGLFQIYLFEMATVTISHIRALSRVFRNRAGNYLLVLTSDYERLDFILLEKYLPGEGDTAGIASKQIGIRPRVLTIDRRKPGRIYLRVLRRFTWTESDPFAQYDKLLSAYSVADWSEEFFNNRALFSDYYLLERLPAYPAWFEDPKPSYLRLRELYQGSISRFTGKEKNPLRKDLLEPVLQVLGFKFNQVTKSGKDMFEPDYRLFSPDKPASPVGLCLVYPWGRSLDGKDDQRDKETPEENPGAVVVSLLEKGEAPWVMVTNGKLWRLYAQRAHSRATNYYEVDLDEILAQSGPKATDPSEAFRYFWILFRTTSFVPKEMEREGKRVSLSLLDQLLLESEDYAKELGERLKGRVFEEVFPHLASGFIDYIREREGAHTDFSGDELDRIFQGTLTLLYRLLFLLYAEARDLLPVKEVRGYFEASLTRMKRQIGSAAGTIADEVGEGLNKNYREDGYELFDRLTHLFQMVDKGNSALNVPIYNGGLFLTDPEEGEDSPEAETARFLKSVRVPARFLAKAIDLLARDIDPKRQDLVSIDYKSLGVRQLGSIYEGLLEFKLRIADRKLAIVKEKGREVYVPFNELAEKEKERADHQGKVVKKGQVYLENDKRERKATGSYYTPDHIVKYIVEHAVGPVLQQKFNTLRPKLREAQQKRLAFLNRQESFRKQGLKPEPASKADLIGRELVDEVFNIRVLDPAMGSGHFLVETVDFITDKTLDFLNSFPWNPVFTHLSRMRETILREMDDQGITIDAKRLTDVNLLKRQVLKRCIYGVDLNPMAVELAKVSLWLDCFTLGAPLSFLDHHLRCGNSLIGVNVKEAREAVEPEEKIVAKEKRVASAKEWKEIETKASQLTLFGSRFAGLLLATDLMRHVGELSDITSAQVRESRIEYRKASDALASFKRILDVYTSQWFGNGTAKSKKGRPQSESPATEFLKSRGAEKLISAPNNKTLKNAIEGLPAKDREIAETALNASTGKRFFHWELEFPEVFYGPRPGTTQVIERVEGAGFDAVIGNPPYDVLASEEIGYDVSEDLQFYEDQDVYAPAIRGKKNLYKLFVCRGKDILTSEGYFSFIVPMALLGDDQAAGVRHLLLEKATLTKVESFPQKDDPKKRVFPEAKLATCIFVAQAKLARVRINIRTHDTGEINEKSSSLSTTPQEIIAFDKINVTIPSCTQRDWDIATRILITARMKKLGEYCHASQGEVNETSDGKKGFVSKDPKIGPQILRGSNICLYVLREASQGEPIYLRKDKYLKGKPDSLKARHFEQCRVGWQESSPQNNFRRIIAAFIPQGEFCNHKINYIPEEDSKLSIDFVLALLNSKISDWFFRLGSTNAAVSHYQIYNLPCLTFTSSLLQVGYLKLLSDSNWSELGDVLTRGCTEPGVMPKTVAEALVEMSRRIQQIEARRVLKNRSERSHLDPESQPIQDAIDAILFRCYGLSHEEGEYISKRLKEML